MRKYNVTKERAMRYVKAHGSFYKVGCEVGEACRADIPELYERNVNYLLNHTRVGSSGRMHQTAARYMAAAERLWPQSVEFLLGLAKGANVNKRMISLTAFTEEISSEFPPAVSDKCSTLVMRLADGNHLIVHNEDYEPQNFGKMVVFDVTFDGFPRLAGVAYPGQLFAGVSLNAYGVAITNNGLWPEARPGLPKQVLHCYASLARDMSEAEHLLALQPNSVTTHYVVACGLTREVISLAVSNLDTSETNVALRSIANLPSFAFTNHIPQECLLKLKRPDPAPKLSPHTVPRYAKLKRLALEDKLPQTPQAALDLFSTNDGVIHRAPEQSSTSVTLATVVIRPETKEFWIRDADPSAAKRDWYFSL